MNELIFNFNNQAVAKTGQGGIVDYDLYAVAKCLGYYQPRRAVQDFVRKSPHFQYLAETFPVDLEKADERVLYAFLFYSKAEKAIEFQRWVLMEVLPAVRRMYEEHITYNECVLYLTDNIGTCTLDDVYARFPRDIADRAIKNTPRSYRLLGFVAPSEVGLPTKQVLAILDTLQVFDSEGCPTPEYAEHLIEVEKYAGKNSRARWFALSQELVRKVLAYTTPPAPVCLVLQSDSYSSPTLPRRKKKLPQTELH